MDPARHGRACHHPQPYLCLIMNSSTAHPAGPTDAQRPRITHQSGRGNLATLQAAYQQAGVDAECIEFVDDMVALYRDADVLICRAGALTIAELTAATEAAIESQMPRITGRGPCYGGAKPGSEQKGSAA